MLVLVCVAGPGACANFCGRADCLRFHCIGCRICLPPDPPLASPLVPFPSPLLVAKSTPSFDVVPVRSPPPIALSPARTPSPPPRPPPYHPLPPPPPTPCFAAGRTNVMERGAGGCGVLRQKEHCEAHYFAGPVAVGPSTVVGGSSHTPLEEANICAWDGRSKRCQLSQLTCLLLDIPVGAVCAAKRLAFVHVPKAGGSTISALLTSCALKRFYWNAELPGNELAPEGRSQGESF